MLNYHLLATPTRLEMIGKAIARVLTCQFAVWDIADLGYAYAYI
ncbi:hypothetical protein [Nostoc sp.]